MPTYVYSCDECGQQFEHFQSFKDAPLETCVCGKSGAVRRVFQPVGIVFKGSGWYINDSRNSNSSTVGAANNSTKETTSTDSKETTDTSTNGSESNKEAKGDTASNTAKVDTASAT